MAKENRHFTFEIKIDKIFVYDVLLLPNHLYKFKDPGFVKDL